MTSLDFIEATDQLVRGAAQFLACTGVKVGLTGFCLGGAVTIIGAVRVPEFAAGVCFYGIPPKEAADPAQLRIPLQGHFANQDDWCTPQAVDAFEQACKAAKQDAEIHRYAAKHGFVNEQRPDVHERRCAEQAWGRMLGFWERHLK